jgi:hypothetical protein
MANASQNPRDVLADLFAQTHPSVAWAIRRSPTYHRLFDANKAHAVLTDHTSDFLSNIESGIKQLDEINTGYEATIQNLNALIASQAETISLLRTAASTTAMTPAQKKRKSKDPPAFAGKGTPTERQAEFETWHVKVRGVFDRDWDYFDTPKSRILHISDLLEGKAYDYIKQGLTAMLENPNDVSRWVWSTHEEMLAYLVNHYEIIDKSQVAKNKLDNLPQGDRSYWSWKGELDELMNIARKTNEQKVDLLRKFISPKMKDLALTLHHEIGSDDYAGWSRQMDIFAKNLANHAHLASLEKRNHRPPAQAPAASPTVAPVVTGDPMDLDRISDTERKRRVENKLCLACGQSGHWKDAHDPARTANPIPIPVRQTASHPNRGNPRGRGIHYGRGGWTSPHNPNPARQLSQVMPYMGAQPFNNVQQQWRLRANDYEPGYVVSEESSSYAPTEADTASQTDFGPPRQDSPMPQALKDQPLD